MILGMTALAQSGKDTTAKMIAEETNMSMYALAQPIKDIMCALFDWNDDHRDGTMKEVTLLYVVLPEYLEKAGEVYNSYGLDKYEAFHDCWEKVVDLFEMEYCGTCYECTISPRKAFQLFGTEWGRSIDNKLWLKLAPKENVIITDVRFPNEAKYFKDKGAKILKVERDNVIKVNEHISEAGLPSEMIDVVIDNNGTRLDLEATVRYLVATDFRSGRYVRGFN